MPVTVAQQNDVNAVGRVHLEATPGALTAGESTVLSVTLKDRYNNPVTGLSGGDLIIIKDLFVDEEVTGLSWRETGSGIYTSSALMMKLAGTHSLQAKVVTNIGEYDDSATIQVNHPSGSRYVKQVEFKVPAEFNAGEEVTAEVTIKDEYGNGVAGVAEAITLTEGAYVLNINFRTTDTVGVYKGMLTLTKAGEHLLKVTISEANETKLVKVNPLAAAALYLKSISAGASVGENTVVTVRLTDRFGNGVSGFAADIRLSDDREDLSDIRFRPSSVEGEYEATVLLTRGALQHTMTATMIYGVDQFNSTKSWWVDVPSGSRHVVGFSIDDLQQRAGSNQQADILVSVRDRYDNHVRLNASDFTISSSLDGQLPVSLRVAGSGTTAQYSLTIISLSPGRHTLTLTLNGISETREIDIIPAGG
ncbi:hypothetical protein GJV78_22505 [Escherichia alba]|uniref:Invasin domain-containing protein n=1 Tax=Intestinirhabdus alba TaxID=2899544 RepID=A0A6L6IR02_9ENTR|nr:hypothetical protein [Intestinirhabdus alba]